MTDWYIFSKYKNMYIFLTFSFYIDRYLNYFNFNYIKKIYISRLRMIKLKVSYFYNLCLINLVNI